MTYCKNFYPILSILIFLVFSRCEFQQEVPVDQDVWPYASPSSVMMDEDILLNLDQAIKNGDLGSINSLIVIKNDQLVYENYYNQGVGRITNLPLNAVTASITSAMVGIALENGIIGSIDDPIEQYLPEYEDLFRADPEKSNITIDAALSMKLGIGWNENFVGFNDPTNNAFQMTQSSDWVGFILAQPRDAPVGLRFGYNSGTALILAKIIENASGIPYEEYIQTMLFDPLDIKSAEWSFTTDGLPNTAWGLTLNSIDLTKLGYLYLKEGDWFGTEVIPSSWVQASTDLQFQISNFNDFGRQWWRYSQSSSIQNFLSQNDIYYANGTGSQYLYVIPHLDMVVSITANTFQTSDFSGFVILRDGILPSLR